MPSVSQRIARQLNISCEFTLEEVSEWGAMCAGHLLGDIEPIFPKKK